MRPFFYFLLAGLIITGSSCNEIIDKVAKENAAETRKLDSLDLISEEENPLESSTPISDKFDIIEKYKQGTDSIHKVRTYYISGEKFSDELYKNHKRDGIFVFYYPNGNILCRLKCKDGHYDELLEVKSKRGKNLDGGNLKAGNGLLKIYNPETERVDFEMNLKNYLRQGEFMYYYATGDLKAKGHFDNDSIDGLLEVYFKNGNKRTVENYKHGKLDGKQLQFYTNGKFKRVVIWKNDTAQSISEYTREGKLTLTATPQLEKKITYHTDGAIFSESTRVNGLKEGKFIYYHENKKLKMEQIWSKDTLLSEKEWFDNGKLKSESVYKNNMKSGLYKEYYANGNLRQVAEYDNDKQNGKTTSYYGNGKIYFIGSYIDDKPIGKFDYYKEDGSFKGSNIFK